MLGVGKLRNRCMLGVCKMFVMLLIFVELVEKGVGGVGKVPKNIFENFQKSRNE